MDDYDWEERPEDVPFWRHALAGSVAGISEHVGMFPIDTLKTRMQAVKGLNNEGVLSTARTIVRETTQTSLGEARGFSALYRGATAIAFGAVPAHIGLFSTYEYCKIYVLNGDSSQQPWRTAACGAAGAAVHDFFIVPGDVVKQRLQLGAYKGVGDCAASIVKSEGLLGLYRSYPVTLMINAPFTAVLVGVNEWLQLVLGFTPEHSVGWYFVFAGVGGIVAGILTLPLDVVKTRLQTQNVGLDGARASSIKYTGIIDTVRKIMIESGPRGFMQGLVPRMIQAGPSAAICWGTYQATQKALAHSANAVTTITTTADQILGESEDPLDWETWDPLEVPFWKHVVAGSTAGVMEHVAMYPVDTVKCRMQALQATRSAELLGVRETVRNVLAEGGVASLFRGCWVIGAGCIPAHVGLFGTYELSKKYLLKDNEHQPLRAAFCGAISTVVHDTIIVPMDVVKQRLQLGVYTSAVDCVMRVSRTEGPMAFFRSLPSTLIMECPFYAVLVAANESLKVQLKMSDASRDGRNELSMHFVTAGVSGILASALTQPLDVIKTRLQTQQALLGEGTCTKVKYRGLVATATSILKEEGPRSFFRGTLPRMAFAAPSAAMCWGTYEVVKRMLVGV